MNNRFFKIISLFMTVAYIIFGLFIAFFADLPNLSPITRYLFAAFIIAYGIFRGFRALKLSKAKNEDDEKKNSIE